MGERGQGVVISKATQSDCRVIARVMLERRAGEAGFQNLARRPIQRLLYERWAAPRFLARTADTFRADLEDQMVGYVILLYEHPSVTLLDMAALEGFKKQGIEQTLVGYAEEVARGREYPYLRAGLAGGDDYITEIFEQAGFQPLEFRRWEYKGTVTSRDAPDGVTMRSLVGRAAMEKRTHYMKAELDGAQPEGRELIEAHYLPKRPTVAQAFELVHADESIGYLSAKREKDIYVLGLSTLPQWWGHDLEADLVTSFPATAGRTSEVNVRLRLDTTPHADAANALLTALGLERTLVEPDIWFRCLKGVDPDSSVSG